MTGIVCPVGETMIKAQLVNVNQLWTFYSLVVGGGALYSLQAHDHSQNFLLMLASTIFFAGNFITLRRSHVSLIKIWCLLKSAEGSNSAVVDSLEPIPLKNMQLFYFGVILSVIVAMYFLA
ncbi:MAG: hypothetical protein HQL90_03040 [Magnetococcales bacterium]|nr:hypothetical protein [Magnetococcales bacterium]